MLLTVMVERMTAEVKERVVGVLVVMKGKIIGEVTFFLTGICFIVTEAVVTSVCPLAGDL